MDQFKRVKLFLVFLSVLFVSSALAVEVPTPSEYSPWFSIDAAECTGTGDLTCAPPEETLPDGEAVTVVAIGSNLNNVSVESDPSIETLILPSGSPAAVPGWTGPVLVKGSSPVKVVLGPSTEAARYSFFIKSRNPFKACGKPGQPSLVP